jgi:N,N'-diacetyllegionaminate synthase
MAPDVSVTICGRQIGPAFPIYVIAEAGVNHNGDPFVARQLIDAARSAGADAVKFQLFSAERLVSADAPACDYQKQHDRRVTGQREMLRRLELGRDIFLDLKRHADDVGIHFIATPFGLEELRFLVELDAAAVKIASPDLVNKPLLEAAASTRLPLIVSTGASTLPEVDRAVDLIRDCRTNEEFILLHCVSAYPTPPADARLRCINTLARRFNVPAGFSDHTQETAFGALAIAAGAVVLEKHLTLNRSAEGPDHFFSLEPEPFAAYVAAAHDAQKALGDGQLTCGPVELEVRKLARGSLVAIKPIRSGQRITPSALAVQRPGGGIEPECWDEVLNMVAKTDIAPDTRLSWAMIE